MQIAAPLKSSEFSDLVAALRWRAAHQGERRAFAFVDGDDLGAASPLSYRELDIRARALRAPRRAQGAARARVVRVFPWRLDFLAAFWVCLYARARAAPPVFPARAQSGRTAPRREGGAGRADPLSVDDRRGRRAEWR
ncbi:hypothetical protein G3N57_11630, partial [Paraburkholderia sp. Se-20369]|nr:hypothetical protein [Paraburkholderia sp. Se-20369]